MKFERDQVVIERGSLGVIVQSGDVAFDVVWEGGSTSRYRYSTGRDVVLATKLDLDGQDWVVERLKAEAAAARKERREDARVKRGQVWPSR